MKKLMALWNDLAVHTAADYDLAYRYWNEIEVHYTSGNRFYHTLDHLRFMEEMALEFKADICKWEAFGFAIFYHDFIYDVGRSDNEAQSALLAIERLTALGIDSKVIDACEGFILATKGHDDDSDKDIMLFNDIDLAILGQESNVYEEYAEAVRKEFSIYPDREYKNGRRRVLQHFLERDKIYCTSEFQKRYDNQARVNIEKELRFWTDL